MKIDRLKKVINQLIELEADKLKYVDEEDFDNARITKMKIDNLRNDALNDTL
jgi:hypothetical protein